jgi:hypothetical protein
MLLTSLQWPLSHLELQVQLPWPHAILWICRCSYSPHAQCGFWKVCYPASMKSITVACPLPLTRFFFCSNYEASVRIADLCAKIVSACSPSSKDQVPKMFAA